MYQLYFNKKNEKITVKCYYLSVITVKCYSLQFFIFVAGIFWGIGSSQQTEIH